jgi:digeranylgeranylglycerophospholipid reductase
LSGTRVTETLPSGGVLTETGPVRSRVTVFADGATSAVRNVMPTARNPREIAWGLAQLLEASGLGHSSNFEIRFGSFAPGWRAQLNPLSGDRASLWIFARGVPPGELGPYTERARRRFVGARGAAILGEQRGADPAFVVPHRIAGDGTMACGAAAAQGGLEYGARAGLVAGEVAARAVRFGDTSRRALEPYEKIWRRETAAEGLTLRWGMEALRRLSDVELDQLFGRLSGVVLRDEDVLALAREDPRGALRGVGLRLSARTAVGLGRAWTRAASRSRWLPR